MDKIRVVWICHFSNQRVRERLPLAAQGKTVGDLAPWITNLIEEFKHLPEVELHVISPHPGLRAFSCSFDMEGVHYHFFKADLPLIHRHLGHLFGLESRTGFLRNRLSVRCLLGRIKPELVNLIGAENAYYSSTVLGIKRIPVLISIQGIYSNPDRFKLQKKIWELYHYERKIHRENRYFGVSSSFMPELIKRDCTDPVLFWNRFPLKIVKLDEGSRCDKRHDFVFFARLTPVKGPDDALKALALVKRDRPGVTMRMMGPPASATSIENLKAQARELGIEDNVEITGGYPLHEDLLREAAKARFYLLPTKIDTIPGTIFEAIYLGLPVVSYATGDIPLLNSGDTRVLLSERGDITSLAGHMTRLLDDPALGESLAQKARSFVERWFDNRDIARNFLNQYRAVIANFWDDEPIPPGLLYENYLESMKKGGLQQ